MKKWLILAVIAAVFMVTFPACGGDDGGETVAGDVKAELVGGGDFILVTWTGDPKSDFAVYAQRLDYFTVGDDGLDFLRVGLIDVGQRRLTYKDEDDDFVEAGLTNSVPEQWSYLISVTDFKTKVDFTSTAPDTFYVRFGVAPSNAGGYSLEKFTIVWDNDDSTDDDSYDKDKGYILITS
jgi:hypothetical protein